MAIYRVTLTESIIYHRDIEAKSLSEASSILNECGFNVDDGSWEIEDTQGDVYFKLLSE